MCHRGLEPINSSPTGPSTAGPNVKSRAWLSGIYSVLVYKLHIDKSPDVILCTFSASDLIWPMIGALT